MTVSRRQLLKLAGVAGGVAAFPSLVSAQPAIEKKMSPLLWVEKH